MPETGLVKDEQWASYAKSHIHIPSGIVHTCCLCIAPRHAHDLYMDRKPQVQIDQDPMPLP